MSAPTVAECSAYLVAMAKSLKLSRMSESSLRSNVLTIDENQRRISDLQEKIAGLEMEVRYKEELQRLNSIIAELHRAAGLADRESKSVQDLLTDMHEVAERISRMNQRLVFKNVEPVEQEELNAKLAEFDRCLKSMKFLEGQKMCSVEKEELQLREEIRKELSRCEVLFKDVLDHVSKLSFATIGIKHKRGT